MILLFLDFDGVLHPAPPHNRDVGVFSCLEKFEAVLRDFPELKIVISSSWREQFDLDMMRSFFADDIAARIIGVLPSPWTSRQKEIKHYLAENNFSALPWIVLDDAAAEFSADLHNFILCNTERGFDDKAEAELREKLQLLRSIED